MMYRSRSELWTSNEALHAALTRRYPQMAAVLVRSERTGLAHVRVTYRENGPRDVEWAGRCFQWRGHPGGEAEAVIAKGSRDPELVADAIAAAFGIRHADTAEQ